MEPYDCNKSVEARVSLDKNPQVLIFDTITKVKIHERDLTHIAKLTGSTRRKMPTIFPQRYPCDSLNSRVVTLIPFVGARLLLDQNLHVLISDTISKVKIHRKKLTHVAKLTGRDEHKCQQNAR